MNLVKIKPTINLEQEDIKSTNVVCEKKNKKEYFSGEIDDLPESVFINIAKELLKEN